MVLRVADICAKVGEKNLYIATDSSKIEEVAKKSNLSS